MVIQTASEAILGQMAETHRLALSRWRAIVLLRRATLALPSSQRRWQRLPQHLDDISPLLRQMRKRDEIRPIAGHPQLDIVTVPYARPESLDEREVLFELHPYAVLSHRSAFVFHGLTLDLPKNLTITIPADGHGELLPLGTTPTDWEGLQPPSGTIPRTVLGRPVVARRVKPAWFFGFAEYQPLGFPIRYTGIERTLIDGLTDPDLCGGIDAVLQAWSWAREIIDMDVLVHQVERMEIGILRQRVGFVLDQLSLTHPRLARWRATSQRGGSSRLVASEPFATTYDERWNLSINVPTSALHSVLT